MPKLLAMAFIVMLLLGGMTYWSQREALETKCDTIIVTAATYNMIDPALIKSVIWKESRFDPNARGTSGEIGLMQVTPGAGYEWAEAHKVPGFNPEHLLDRRTNIWAGTWYLSQCLERFKATDRPAVYGLAAYNAGPTKASSWAIKRGTTNSTVFLDAIKYPGTRQYVLDILRRRQRYLDDFQESR